MNELKILSAESLDKEIIENSLEKVVEWLTHKRKNDIAIEPNFIPNFQGEFSTFLKSMSEQISELDYNALWKLKLSLRELNSFDFAKMVHDGLNQQYHFSEAIENRYNSFLKLYQGNSKKIKKQKNLEKKKKLFDTEKNQRKSAIEQTNSMLQEDAKSVNEYKKEEKIEEINAKHEE